MTPYQHDRREMLRRLGLGAAALPFVSGLPSLRASEASTSSKKRFIVFFSPNGTLPSKFWPDEFGKDAQLKFKPMLSALEPFADQALFVKGACNKIRGDGDGHMRGMSCLLTGDILNPGNIQGGSDTPAGWASSPSIDQIMRNHYQADESTHTRFGSLEFGVAVPNRADPWTRMVYAGSDKPIAPVNDPGQMFKRLYGGAKDRQSVASVLDEVYGDLARVQTSLSSEDRELLDAHMEQVRKLEEDIKAAENQAELTHPEPEIDPAIELINDNTPEISRMQIDLMVNAMANDMTRIATIQYMRSVGMARMRWLGIEEGHHSLSHEPDSNKDADDKLTRINEWFAGELAYLAQRLADTPEPGGVGGTMLDHTQIVWVNELGKGNSHTLNDIPFLFLGGGCGFQMGRALDFDDAAHNRLWLSVAHGLGHEGLQTFGAERFCEGGALELG